MPKILAAKMEGWLAVGVDRLIVDNIHLILNMLGISKKALISLLEQEQIEFKVSALNPLFKKTEKPIRVDIVNKVISCLDIPVSLVTSTNVESQLTEWLNFINKVSGAGSVHDKANSTLVYEKQIKTLNRRIERLLQKNKEQIAKLKQVHRAKIRELKRKNPKIRHLNLHDNLVHVSGIIPKTREAQFNSWCAKPPQK